MRKELEQKFADRWPAWFDLAATPQLHVMARGFEHWDGWFDLVWRLCEDLEPLVVQLEKQRGESFEVLAVKERFGGLRFYVNQYTEAVMQRIEAAELEAFRTCEICGQPGTLRKDIRLQTLCDRCIGHRR